MFFKQKVHVYLKSLKIQPKSHTPVLFFPQVLSNLNKNSSPIRDL